ncbi:hypothetical protein [Bacillus sp. P14.5]|uniref:hypothetical protein n=1 Tax=Bacillus sp. P14.5 TaxID=1983400 RepID=UPI0013B06769|nr:hypothetical protein [Bacillus sp. P14.5]
MKKRMPYVIGPQFEVTGHRKSRFRKLLARSTAYGPLREHDPLDIGQQTARMNAAD